MPTVPAATSRYTRQRPTASGLPLILALAAGAIACSDSPSGLACTAEIRPGILLEIRDSTTDLPAAFEAEVVAQAGTFKDTLRIPGQPLPTSSEVVGAFERPGTYSLVVESPKYLPWSRSGVRVTAGPCHVNSVRLTARLTPRG